MKIGAVFPQTEIGSDPQAVRDYAQAVEELGFDHLLAFDHVVGADPDRPGGWDRVYDKSSMFHEPMVLFGFLAGLTKQIGLVTNVIILPQRQAVLMAKQAAEVDVLSDGRLRLGVGIGWNHVEYQSLNEDFTNRGRRIVEQIAVMRALWTNEVVDFKGRWHKVELAGLNPLPIQRPIPIWLGGGADAVLRRVARYADGWFPQFPLDENAKPMMERLQGYIREAGRKPTDVGIEARLEFSRMNWEEMESAIETWRDLGATYIGINTMRAELKSPDDHIKVLTQFRELTRQYS